MSLTKSAVILMFLAIGAISAAPQGDLQTSIPILAQSQEGPNPDGSYSWSYETGNGIQAQEQGSLLASASNNDEGALSVKGSFSYIGDDGTPIQLTYTADESGFQPKGDHLPVAPEIPPAILRALEWIAAHPEEDNLRK